MPVMDIERPKVATGRRQRRGQVSDTRLVPTSRPPAVEVTGPGNPSWEPLSGDALLQRLRITGRPRPAARPELARMLERILGFELARRTSGRVVAAGSSATNGSGSGSQLPVLVTKDRLTGVMTCEAHRVPTDEGGTHFSSALACGSLVDVLFRQLVTVGSIGDPMEDGLAALEVDDRQSDLRAWIGGLAGPERGELWAEVERQAAGLLRRWPPLHPAWLPRTQESLRARPAGGAVELSARVDLVIGRPARDEGSVAIVEVKSGSRRVEHRTDLHFYALLEALRSPAPPFVVATYYSRTGELDVDPVTDELLVAAARRTAVGSRLLVDQAHGVEPARPSGPLCGRCSILPGGSLACVGAIG